jgi:hypothetical protein
MGPVTVEPFVPQDDQQARLSDRVDHDVAALAPAGPGLDVERVLRETERRLAIAADWRERRLTVTARPERIAARQGPLNTGRAEILERVNGRRTVRDIAFAVGRGLFP